MWVAPFLFAGGCFQSCNGGFNQPDVCAPGSTGALDSVEVGFGTPENSLGSSFLPIADGATLHSAFGGQGARMVIVQLRLRGAFTSDCIAQKTVLATGASGDVLARNDAAVFAQLRNDGSRVTHNLFMPGDIPQPGAGAALIATAGGRTAVAHVILGDLTDGLEAIDAGAADGP